MDLISGLKSELFRPLVTLLVPGAIAVAPFVLIVHYNVPAARAFWVDHSLAFSSTIVVAIIAAGMILEDLGARIEILWDHLRGGKIPDYETTWSAYLGLNIQDQLVAQRYLRTILTRMKFELSTGPALIAHAIGLVWLNQLQNFFSTTTVLLLVAGILAVAVYLLCESYSGSKLLHDVRKIIVASETQRTAPAEQPK